MTICCLLLICTMQQSCSSSESEPVQPEETENVLFKDDFETFNAAVWTKEVHEAGWTNQELQTYDEAHVSVGTDEGKSVLILTAERQGNRILSGRVNSKGKQRFQYGKIEASIKLPRTANGLWPAFWMMGDNDLEWPQCGEIDIMEMGEQGGIAAGTTECQVNTAIHYGSDAGDGHRQEYHTAEAPHSLQDGQYHTYTLERSENSLTVLVDGTRIHTFDISRLSGRHDYFQGNFYLLFNLAVGGSFTGITDINGITALKDGERVSMYVDWVKVSRE